MQRVVLKILVLMMTIFILTQSSDAYDGFGIEKATIISLGYRIQSRVISVPSQWEKEQFNLLEKRSIRIKSLKPLQRFPDTYYRFTISEEKYGSDREAEARLHRLFDKPPDLYAEDRKMFPLRRGFQYKNMVYVVSTDASMFMEQMEIIFIL